MADFSQSGRQLTIRFQLACLVIACVLPVWLAAGFLVRHIYLSNRSHVTSHMLEAARALSMTVDRELASIQAALQVLATSPAFASGDLAAVHRQALQVLRSYPEADIIVADITGQQLVNSYRPYGDPLPKRNTPETVRRIFASGNPIVSDLFFGAVTRQPLIAIDVPVFSNGRVIYDLSMTLHSKRVAAILSQGRLPANWFGTILDSKGVLVARTHESQRFVGRPLGPFLSKAMSGTPEGATELVNLEGIPAFESFSRSTVSGWAVVIGVPTAVVMAEMYEWLWWALGGVALLSLIGIVLAMMIGRRIARSIQLLVTPARTLGNGEPVIAVGPHSVRETEDVAAALVQASELLQGRAEERDRAQQALVVKQRQLEELNNSLEERISTTVRELRQKDQILIQQSRLAALGEMIGNIAHQWRQPLNALGLLLADIQDTHRANELTTKYLEQNIADGNRLVRKMSSTINDFRNFFRPDKEIVVFSVREQISAAISLVMPSFRNQNIDIRFDAPYDMQLVGFPNEYSQVLLNLLSNAKESIELSGVGAGVISIRLGKRDGLGCVTITDNGGGIPADSMDRIFEPYFSTKQMGTGIGLYMSKMIIEHNMNGSIEACNVDGGAQFTVISPVARIGQ
jgi:C4-dicarboxylate-specific signal transduction histidine kinase